MIFAEALDSRIDELGSWPCPPKSARIEGPAWAGRVKPCILIEEPDPAQMALIGIDYRKALAERERVGQEIQQYQKAISDMEEEARQLGLLPGWLR